MSKYVIHSTRKLNAFDMYRQEVRERSGVDLSGEYESQRTIQMKEAGTGEMSSAYHESATEKDTRGVCNTMEISKA